MTRRKAAGFTLIEMMVVVAIILIFITIVFTLSLSNFGGNAQNVSDSITGQFSLARMRAVSTKRPHLILVNSTSVAVYQCNTRGMVTPTAPLTTSCNALVNKLDLPQNVSIWAAVTGAQGSGANPAQGLGLPFQILIYADGTAPPGATLYVTDVQKKTEFRVLQYPITGASYDRQYW